LLNLKINGQGYERCKRAYNKKFCCGQPTNLHFRSTPIEIQDAMGPADYKWENLSTPTIIRFFRVSISNILAISILVIGFAAIIKVGYASPL
jgi:hypothetical protein